MSRNEERLGLTDSKISDAGATPPLDVGTASTGLNFTVPTELVDLPTKGKLYPDDHPLKNVEHLEIRYMTAKDEDILTSPSLLRKGLAVERLLQNILIDKSVNIDDLFVGDKNALIIAARITGYGSEYETNIVCPVCGTHNKRTFELSDLETNFLEAEGEDYKLTDSGTFLIKLPKSKLDVEVRLLNGHDEKQMVADAEKRAKHGLPESTMTEQFKRCLVTVAGSTDRGDIHNFVENMPALDSRFLRKFYNRVAPDVDLRQDFKCSTCSFEERLEVPLTAEFFWPQ